MGYTRRRAALSEIERVCSLVMLAYQDSAGAWKAGEADKFRQSLELIRLAAQQLGELLRSAEAGSALAGWLVVSPRLDDPQGFAGPPPSTTLADGARLFDAGPLPSLLSAVAELHHHAQQRIAYLRQVM